MFFRAMTAVLLKRLQEKRQFIQVLAGPRQVGKTTLMLQVAEKLELPYHYASADEPGLQSASWIAQQWEIARHISRSKGTSILVLDEVQKLPHWSSVVKQHWD